MAPIPPPGAFPPPDPSDSGGLDGMPDLSHLSEEERQIILQVIQRQKQEEQKEEEVEITTFLAYFCFNSSPLDRPKGGQRAVGH